nr:secondary thiamine-phosphate synthase enzyme YjbQ [Candidatus Njordarchaeum guaymaensis]
MEVEIKTISIRTDSNRQVVDVTPEVRRFVKEVNVKTGLTLIWVPHTTAAIVINEHDRRLWEDLLAKLEELVPARGKYNHDGEENAHAHIVNALLGHGVCIAIDNGELSLGTWQSILFVEMDGPRERSMIMRVYH